MELDEMRSLYEGRPPFATVYLEARSPAEDSPQQVRLRWEELRRDLVAQGAGDEALEALDRAVLGEEAGEVLSSGRVLVADASAVRLDAPWDAALGAGDAAHLAQEPELGAYLRERARSVSMLVAVADQHGAVIRDLTVSESDVPEPEDETVVDDDSDTVHKPREGALSHKQIQRRADEVAKQNLREVAEHLEDSATRRRPDLVVLAGEVQGRTTLREELPASLQQHYAEVQAGGISDDGAEEALADELRALAAGISEDRAREHRERFEAGKAHGLAVEGSEAVAQAAERGAIEMLLLEEDRSAREEAGHLGGAVRTGAAVGLVDTELADAIAAILRFQIAEGTR